MLAIDNISKSFGAQTLFRCASFAIGPKSRIGVIGPNGAGKSTFFKMLVDEERADTGDIRFPRNYRVALLRQEWQPNSQDTVLTACLREHRHWYQQKESLFELAKQLKHQPSNELLQQYQLAEDHFLSLGGYATEQRAKEYLSGLGFSESLFGQPAAMLSGGWRIRCHLAGLLLQDADLLLLDEPTNHLDVEAVVWFENFLLTYPHAVMLISHDRRLIERFAQDILEFSPPTLTLWPGNLRQYETLKQSRMDLLEARITNQQKEIERLDDFVRRFRAKATKARQAQNRLKTADHYREEMNKLKEEMPQVSVRQAKFSLKLPQRLPQVVLSVDKAVFGYSPQQPLFTLPSVQIERGKKMGIIGVNGVGKSTFLKSCSQELPLLQGCCVVTSNVSVGYYAQHRLDELPPTYEVLDYLYDQVDQLPIAQVRQIAATLGLSSNDVKKRVDVLSGGEKARVSLAKILLRRPGLLLLDEPTNHLDMEACEALSEGLKQYEGTILVVSHNRDFLDSLVDYVLEIRPGQADLYHGNYSYWFDKRGALLAKTSSQTAGPSSTPQPSRSQQAMLSPSLSAKELKEQKRLQAQERQKIFRQKQILIDQLNSLDQRLERDRSELLALEQTLCDPSSPKSPEFGQWVKRQKELTLEIERLEQRWLNVSQQLEELGS